MNITIMNDIVNDIISYMEKDKIDIIRIINQFNEKDIADAFVNDLNSIKYSYSSFLKVVSSETLNEPDSNIRYSKNIFKYSMLLIFNYNNYHAINNYEIKIRRLSNHYVNSDRNIVAVLNVVKSIIDKCILHHDSFKKYDSFKISIIFTIENSINKKLSKCYDTDYQMNMVNAY